MSALRDETNPNGSLAVIRFKPDYPLLEEIRGLRGCVCRACSVWHSCCRCTRDTWIKCDGEEKGTE